MTKWDINPYRSVMLDHLFHNKSINGQEIFLFVCLCLCCFKRQRGKWLNKYWFILGAFVFADNQCCFWSLLQKQRWAWLTCRRRSTGRERVRPDNRRRWAAWRRRSLCAAACAASYTEDIIIIIMKRNETENKWFILINNDRRRQTLVLIRGGNVSVRAVLPT